MFHYELNYNLIYPQKNNSKKILLFLHGWGCSKKSFEGFERFFLNEYIVLNLDLYGFGDSNLPDGYFDIYEYAKNIYIFLNKIKHNSIDIICHSFGARIAIVLSNCFNLNINKIIITGGAGLKPRFNPRIYFKKLFYKIFIKNVGILKIKNFGSDDFKSSSKNLKTVLVRVVNQHLNYLVENFNMSNKVLLIWGKDDRSTPLYMAKYFYHHINNSIIKIINGGHFCFLDDAEKFINLSKKFLNK